MKHILTLIAGLFLCTSSVAGEFPPATGIISNVLARAELAARRTNFLYSFTRLNCSQELQGTAPEEKKVYLVSVHGTNVVSTLTKLNDVPVPVEKQRATSRASDKRRSMGISGDITDRYEFQVVGMEVMEKHHCYKLTFQPRNDLDDESITDKVLNRLGGELWVDQDTYEIAQLNVRLLREASIWGGLAGELSVFNLSLTKTPLHPDLWVNKRMDFEVKGRKLFSGFHYKSREECAEITFEGSSPFLD